MFRKNVVLQQCAGTREFFTDPHAPSPTMTTACHTKLFPLWEQVGYIVVGFVITLVM